MCNFSFLPFFFFFSYDILLPFLFFYKNCYLVLTLCFSLFCWFFVLYLSTSLLRFFGTKLLGKIQTELKLSHISSSAVAAVADVIWHKRRFVSRLIFCRGERNYKNQKKKKKICTLIHELVFIRNFYSYKEVISMNVRQCSTNL